MGYHLRRYHGRLRRLLAHGHEKLKLNQRCSSDVDSQVGRAQVHQRLPPNLFDPLLGKALLQGVGDEVGSETTLPGPWFVERLHSRTLYPR
jgi:hypothetical protein